MTHTTPSIGHVHTEANARIGFESCWDRLRRLPHRLHGDERGVISLVTVFVALVFTMILAMILNIARHVDDRMRLQNAADASTYSGGVVMARGLNTLAFTNHLLAESFALTAYLDVLDDTDFHPLTDDILAAWQNAGEAMEDAASSAGVDKFQRLGAAIQNKIPIEAGFVDAYHDIAGQHARMTVGAFRAILGPRSRDGGPIPRFQRALVQSLPNVAQLVSDGVARRYGQLWESNHREMPITAAIWRAHVDDARTLAGQDESSWRSRTVPAVDPSPFGPDRPDGDLTTTDYYVRTARSQRRDLAFYYLENWTSHWMARYFSYGQGGAYSFDVAGSDFPGSRDLPGNQTAKMSDLIDLVRGATRAELAMLLEDAYRYVNLPHVYRRDAESTVNEHLDRDHTYVGVAYWNHIDERAPGVFENPLERNRVDALAFAQSTVFLPRPRYRTGSSISGSRWRLLVRTNEDDGTRIWQNRFDGWPMGRGSSRGDTGAIPLEEMTSPHITDLYRRYSEYPRSLTVEEDPTDMVRDDRLLAQNWMAKLVPTTSPAIPRVLSTQPPTNPAFRSPNLRGMSTDDVNRVSFH